MLTTLHANIFAVTLKYLHLGISTEKKVSTHIKAGITTGHCGSWANEQMFEKTGSSLQIEIVERFVCCESFLFLMSAADGAGVRLPVF